MKLPAIVRISSIAAATLLMASCAIAPGTQPTATSSPALPSSATATPTSVATATLLATATPTNMPEPTPSAIVIGTPQPTDYEQRPPPNGEIVLPDGSVVAGQIGSWCYQLGCADSPALPKRIVPLMSIRGSATTLTFRMPDSVPFATWTVSYAADADADFTNLASGGTYIDPDSSSATQGPVLNSFTFDGVPRGDWLLTISVWFPGTDGDAIYYWHAKVA